MQFDYLPLGVDYIHDLNQLKIITRVLEKAYIGQAKELHLEDLYEHHKDIVQDLLKKKEIYTDAYINSLLNDFPQYFRDRDDLRRILFGTPLNEEEYCGRPLSKLTHDIVEN